MERLLAQPYARLALSNSKGRDYMDESRKDYARKGSQTQKPTQGMGSFIETSRKGKATCSEGRQITVCLRMGVEGGTGG